MNTDVTTDRLTVIRYVLFIAFWVVFIFAVTGCAHTTIYSDNGKKLAEFQGDMENVKFRRLKNGTTEWSADKVSHSDATLAQGKAASDKLAAGGLAASGLLNLLK